MLSVEVPGRVNDHNPNKIRRTSVVPTYCVVGGPIANRYVVGVGTIGSVVRLLVITGIGQGKRNRGVVVGGIGAGKQWGALLHTHNLRA